MSKLTDYEAMKALLGGRSIRFIGSERGNHFRLEGGYIVDQDGTQAKGNVFWGRHGGIELYCPEITRAEAWDLLGRGGVVKSGCFLYRMDAGVGMQRRRYNIDEKWEPTSCTPDICSEKYEYSPAGTYEPFI